MAIYLDSAVEEQVSAVMKWGFVAGVTTNPRLLATAGYTSLDALDPLCKMVPGVVFYQLAAHDMNAMLLEAQAAFSVSPSQVILKIPCTLDGLQALARLSLEIPCAATALFSPAQAYIAKEAGARYVVPYVNRSTRLMGDGVGLVSQMADVLRGSSTEIIAASIKSPPEAVSALQAGAHHLALPFEVIREMTEHPLSRQAIHEFDLAGR